MEKKKRNIKSVVIFALLVGIFALGLGMLSVMKKVSNVEDNLDGAIEKIVFDKLKDTTISDSVKTELSLSFDKFKTKLDVIDKYLKNDKN